MAGDILGEVVMTIRRVPLGDLLELRQRNLTPGHPGRPVIWSYDTGAEHFGLFHAHGLIGCVSVTAQPMPGRSATLPYHLHSMAIEESERGRGRGRLLLHGLLDELLPRGTDLIWATARPSAVGFYLRNGFVAGDRLSIPPTNAEMRFVWLDVEDAATERPGSQPTPCSI